MSDEDLKAELERLRSENATLKKGVSSNIRMKVSEKGAVSVYGMGRFPVTLYKEQWLKLLDDALDASVVMRLCGPGCSARRSGEPITGGSPKT
jgi:hypothetical protein